MKRVLLAMLVACGPSSTPPPPIQIVEELPSFAPRADDEPPAGDPVNTEWLAADRLAIARIVQLAVSAVPVGEEKPVGLELVRRIAQIDAGYGSCTTLQLVHRGVVARLEVRCAYTTENWQKVSRFIVRGLATAQLAIERRAHDVIAKRVVRYAEDAQVATRLASLGPLEPVAGTPEELEAYETLTGTMPLVFGSHCGIDGSDTPGQLAREVLERSGRADLLRNALRGLNPEGRAFAAEGLKNLGKLREQDRAVVRMLAGEPLTLQICSGCFRADEPSSDVFSRL